MVDGQLFDLLNNILTVARQTHSKPFGGLQVSKSRHAVS
jgi:hypothetical protein